MLCEFLTYYDSIWYIEIILLESLQCVHGHETGFPITSFQRPVTNVNFFWLCSFRKS